MKTKSALALVSLFTLTLLAFAVRAEEETPAPEDTSYEAPDATSVTYDQPVTYYASVTYQAAVTYNAPVYYIAAGAAATVAYEAQCQQQQAQAPTPASTVIVVSGGSGTYTYSKYDSECEPASQVIQFGERGGWFGPGR